MRYKKKIGIVERTCIQCNETFTVNLQDSYSVRIKLCSDECTKKRTKHQYEEFILRRREKKGLSLYANCKECGKEFFKGSGRGHHNRVCCSEDCRAKRASWFSKEQTEKAKLKAGVCKINGCNGSATRDKFTVCEAHYCMFRRNGNYEGQYRSPTSKQGNYIRVNGKPAKKHPMSTKTSGMLYEHRMVAYDARNGICEPCFWCGKELEWENCVIDHLNEDKHDNRPENLLIACTHCNRARGAMLGFIARMKESSLPVFYEAIGEYRKKHSNKVS